MTASDFRNIQDAAKAVGMSRFTVWRLIRDGKLHVYQSEIDRRAKLVNMADLAHLIEPKLIESGQNGRVTIK